MEPKTSAVQRKSKTTVTKKPIPARMPFRIVVDCLMAGVQGFEPQLPDPESGVLPLDDTPPAKDDSTNQHVERQPKCVLLILGGDNIKVITRRTLAPMVCTVWIHN